MSSKGCKTDNIRHSLSCKKQKTRPKESESKVGGQRACSIAVRVRGRRAGDPLSSGISIAQWSVGLGGWPGLRTPDSERAGTLVQGGGFDSSSIGAGLTCVGELEPQEGRGFVGQAMKLGCSNGSWPGLLSTLQV